MIKSMTGFASLTREDEHAQIAVTAKSVNHRYLDIQIRAPHSLAGLEPGLRGVIQRHAARGRVELSVAVQLKATPPVSVEVNEPLMAALAKAAKTARDTGLVDGRLTPGDLLRFPQVVTLRERPPSEEDPAWQHLCASVTSAAEEALTELDRMRRREGEFLARDLEERSTALSVLVDGVVAEAEAGDLALRERLAERITDLGDQIEVDGALVAQEIVRWAARSDIHEEVARLRGHLEHMKQLRAEAAPCGRKLDFLIQEMNREVNTIGSKAEGRGMAELVVSAKSEIEKLREQIQNVE